MRRIALLASSVTLSGALAALALAFGGPASAASAPSLVQVSKQLGTLPLGRYECSLPGDASGAAWEPVPEMNFAILNGSSYAAQGARGVYLLNGDTLVFTRGPLKGVTMERAGRRILRERGPDGSLGRMRCVRVGPAD